MSGWENLVRDAMGDLHAMASEYCRRYPGSDGMLMNRRTVKRLGERYSASILWEAAQRLNDMGAAELRRVPYDENRPL